MGIDGIDPVKEHKDVFIGHESHNKLERTCENCDDDHDEQDAVCTECDLLPSLHEIYKYVQAIVQYNTSERCSIVNPRRCSQEISKSEQADLSQTSDSSICNSIKLEALDGLLSFLENGNRENCTTYTTCTKEARITISNVPKTAAHKRILNKSSSEEHVLIQHSQFFVK
ncbi:Hypothetical predicted protein [Mytilus galloprovincialis]|uniref:Uncharacterized protein n=1 Tax=Mytilus galloprovincialis TaxID=29158 RepID=A0A8B6DBD1_MYTGA|nr:Hypothetical predicted protein [Mytilus galloprovincialis]